jgi:hypothetical protein
MGDIIQDVEAEKMIIALVENINEFMTVDEAEIVSREAIELRLAKASCRDCWEFRYQKTLGVDT